MIIKSVYNGFYNNLVAPIRKIHFGSTQNTIETSKQQSEIQNEENQSDKFVKEPKDPESQNEDSNNDEGLRKLFIYRDEMFDSGLFGEDINPLVDKKQKALKKAQEKAVPKKYYQNLHYSDLAGMEDIIQSIKRTIELPAKYPDLFNKPGMKPSRNIFLFGPPGCGKTTLASIIASETERNLLSINGGELQDKYFGETAKKIREAFEAAETLAPSIIFLDECDSIALKRGTGEWARATNDITNQLLTCIDNLKKNNKDVIVIAATNFPEFLDPAFVRKGRMDLHIDIPLPGKKDLKKILELKLKLVDTKIASDVNLDRIIGKCTTMKAHGADIEALVYEAFINGVDRISEDGKLALTDPKNIELTALDFEKALKSIADSKQKALRKKGL